MKQDYFLGLSEEGFHRIVYTEWGNSHPTKSPIICVHGLTRNRRDFDTLAEFLVKRDDYHLFCPDVVGRGDSGWLNNPLHYTYEQYIADMNGLIARTHSHQVDWIGTSMGGLIGLLLAAMPNTPIRRLILNDIGPQVPAAALARLATYAGKDPIFTNKNDAQTYFQTIYADFGHLTEMQWQQFTENSIYEISPGKFASKLDPNIKLVPVKSKITWQSLLHPHRLAEGVFLDIDLWSFWHKITCPILVLHGQKSDILLPEIIQKMQHTHANIEVIDIPHTGHAPALLDPSQHEIIYQWLKQN